MSALEEIAGALQQAVERWLELKRKPDGSVDPGVLGTAVAVTTHLRNHFPLNEGAVATKSQIKGQSGSGVGRVLLRFGETRKFLSEGGRTSRGSRDSGIQLAAELTLAGQAAGFGELDQFERTDVVDSVQGWVVSLLGPEFFDLQRLSPEMMDPSLPVRTSISAIMDAAVERGGNSAGAVAQHLIGATLSIRFPYESIGTDSYTTADQQTARAGDFQVGDTAFHVTMSPSEALFRDRCVHNLQQGFRSVVIVPDYRVAAAIQIAELAGIKDHVDVLALESFIGLSVEDIASFKSDGIKLGLRELLEVFNERIRTIETNLSLQVDIPANL